MNKTVTEFWITKNDISNTPITDEKGNPLVHDTREKAQAVLEKRKDHKNLVIVEVKRNV